jgi:cytidylate kinase
VVSLDRGRIGAASEQTQAGLSAVERLEQAIARRDEADRNCRSMGIDLARHAILPDAIR